MRITSKKQKIVIIGAGPAGLGAAFELTKDKQAELDLLIIDKNSQVGGLARSFKFKGHFFDVGPHRFYTKNKEVFDLWKNTLKKDFYEVPRLTRILYKNKLFFYPIKLTDVIKKLGILESVRCLVSFVKTKIEPKKTAKTFEDWVSQNFGKKLYTIFFKTYTEKVWGIDCGKIGAEWAAQRIKNLSFSEVIKNALGGKNKAKSLIDKFYYPKRGAGSMYEKLASKIKQGKGKFFLDSAVSKIYHRQKKVVSLDFKKEISVQILPVDYLFSSMPLTEFILKLSPSAPAKVVAAAKKLYYRDHITVNLLVQGTNLFPDNWIYIHSPEVQMARVTNYNNFRKNPSQDKTSAIAVEYFVFQDDQLWSLSDEELVALAIKELEQVALINKDLKIEGFVIRETESYPTYYLGHKQYFDILKNYVEQLSNLSLIGRGGMYKYNNMDHSLYSGMLAARNFLLGYKKYDIWQINEDAEYLEEEKPSI
ncbi:hypothetical protein A2631_03200 [Candidatus Daviesbacteria bacterium RIFCSPHIGHO2_01_FULL_44_29]|uniref:Amine oxidase domain-containing protein n=1 Tax=Candidatus Daviesbacteria bacterium RIFCSPHIGHO2_02_FULL_43_12 TaxID=1797776 RepID=A0A1F5KL91_9BACT|nr:MAG: hypothetical protein A2631_03200 [Candidatus Daviesbacteria bacterium RIFCSPHIGHO2_01_FULL_44_29]OGE40309.1 MAG: hypothetical protein A3E86_03885 [Candidatus Daviesbacteria bacterium RIFCSPHIGHO2_12_FULL_47_45]OGE41391.1 MAG: hypothetical protein A3D25_02595 [Candidatus Daviesbacteria bacterium RIFCSPHIGHO2_02_FULL_43_12]OGE69592.1 MAG: hypothetical protein A3B55_04340 [Candidatus Daviesbacteria bacterium RIFCSPLOWO2_01_FULL_43_15]